MALEDLMALLAQLQQILRTAADDPAFTIPGATPLEQLRNFIATIDGSNQGSKLRLYRSLGGTRSR
jgi:hypothetical protein